MEGRICVYIVVLKIGDLGEMVSYCWNQMDAFEDSDVALINDMRVTWHK